MHFSKKAMKTRMQDLLIEEKMELTKSKTWILIEAMYNTITDFDNNYDRKENKAVFDFVDGNSLAIIWTFTRAFLEVNA